MANKKLTMVYWTVPLSYQCNDYQWSSVTLKIIPSIKVWHALA